MSKKFFLLTVLLFTGWQCGLAREAEHQVSVQSNVMVAMRDGVKLATDIYLPAKEAVNDQRTMVTATNTIHHDAAHPSHIVLPVIPKP